MCIHTCTVCTRAVFVIMRVFSIVILAVAFNLPTCICLLLCQSNILHVLPDGVFMRRGMNCLFCMYTVTVHNLMCCTLVTHAHGWVETHDSEHSGVLFAPASGGSFSPR